jgi:hypothetical protein
MSNADLGDPKSLQSHISTCETDSLEALIEKMAS